MANVPDTLRGVPVYQNGLAEALKTFQRSKRINRIDVVSFHSLQSTTDVISGRRAPRLVVIRLLNEKAEFSRVNDQIKCVGVAERSKNSLVI